jgi:uncharacterized surface protein with fasciclin (FAS1) repeats
MKNRLIRKKFQLNPVVLCLFFLGIIFNSCKDNFFETHIPSWLGSSIYDQLKEGYTGDDKVKHTFNYYTRLIDDIGYTEVLQRTGSKTVFVADDDAFTQFFKRNPWNVDSYEHLTLAQKKLILNSSMINNALLIENLSSIEGPVKGQALRHSTAMSVLDTIPFEKGSDLPANSYWDRFRSTGLRLAKDNTPTLMLHFLQAQMDAHNISDKDFSILFNGVQHKLDDAYIFNDRVKQRDITCQNGYIHILDSVLIPPSNMADVLRKDPETTVFSSFLERYAAPYYDDALTKSFSLLGYKDSVFVKRYFAKQGSDPTLYNASKNVFTDPNKNTVNGVLQFDPGWNSYGSQTDMGVIFAPTDAAFSDYFKKAGRPLIDRYINPVNIPDNVLNELISNLMKPSFLAATPTLFPTIVDDAQESMLISTNDIVKTHLTSNGVVYVTNTVYPPALYSSVMLPAKINENMQVFYWAIENNNFKPYLLSMVNTYSFLIPTDNFTYVVPTSLGSNNPVAWKFHYNKARTTVYASVHNYDATLPYPASIGDSVAVVNNSDILLNHLKDMLDYHIIVGMINDNQEYYRTKGGGTIRVVRNGSKLYFAGGGDIERNVSIPVDVSKIYDQSKEANLGKGNGKAYPLENPLKIDEGQPVQSPTKSVYAILSDNVNYPQFSEFFKLVKGDDNLWPIDPKTNVMNPKYIRYSVFNQAGLDYDVRFLNTYHYTLYVPTNEEVLKAIQAGLPTWDDVAAITSDTLRQLKANQIIRFVRYHFQDNGIFLDKAPISSTYQTATLDDNTQTFFKLNVASGSNTLQITDGSVTEGSSPNPAAVNNTIGNYNIMARDLVFNTANVNTATTIVTSSYVVIHQIDRCLYFDGEKKLLAVNVKSGVRRKIVKH